MPLSTTPPRLPPRVEREIAQSPVPAKSPVVGVLADGFRADPFDLRMHVTAGGPHTSLGVIAEIYVFCRECLRREAPDVLKELENLT